MSLVTRCPACDTTFKVVRDQLRISDGWVRCGRCSHVFDASVDLREIDEAPITPVEPNVVLEAPQPPAPEADSSAHFTDVVHDKPPHEEPLPQPFLESPLEPVPDELTGPPEEAVRGPLEDSDSDSVATSEKVDTEATPVEPASIPGPLIAGLVADEPWPEPNRTDGATSNSDPESVAGYRSIAEIAPSLELDAIGQTQLREALRRARVKSVQAARTRGAQARSEIVTPEPTEASPLIRTASENEAAVVSAAGMPPFLRASATSEFWRRPTVRAVLGVGVLVAFLVLAVQVLHRERDAIAARQPSLRPVLARMCVVTGCKLSALRQIGDITIDGAAFARDKVGEGYRLSFTLRNAATVPLAMPAVELSLLDSQEQVVVRRVLMPAEFNAPDELPARAERAASLPLALTGAEAAALPPIAGYRVVAFYP